MPQLAANLSLMYTEHPLPERFAAAAADGFGAVELLFPYELGLSTTRSLLVEHGLSLVLFNAPPGDWMAGDRGLLCLPDRTSEYQDSVRLALDYAQALGTPRIHLMSGLLAAGTLLQDLRPMLIERLRWAAELAETAGCRLCLEPINRRDMPGYALNRQQEAIELIQAVGHPAPGGTMQQRGLRNQMQLVQAGPFPPAGEGGDGRRLVDVQDGDAAELGTPLFVGDHHVVVAVVRRGHAGSGEDSIGFAGEFHGVGERIAIPVAQAKGWFPAGPIRPVFNRVLLAELSGILALLECFRAGAEHTKPCC